MAMQLFDHEWRKRSCSRCTVRAWQLRAMACGMALQHFLDTAGTTHPAGKRRTIYGWHSVGPWMDNPNLTTVLCKQGLDKRHHLDRCIELSVLQPAQRPDAEMCVAPLLHVAASAQDKVLHPMLWCMLFIGSSPRGRRPAAAFRGGLECGSRTAESGLHCTQVSGGYSRHALLEAEQVAYTHAQWNTVAVSAQVNS